MLGFILGGILGVGFALFKSAQERNQLREAFDEGVRHTIDHVPDLIDRFLEGASDAYEQPHHQQHSSRPDSDL